MQSPCGDPGLEHEKTSTEVKVFFGGSKGFECNPPAGTLVSSMKKPPQK